MASDAVKAVPSERAATASLERGLLRLTFTGYVKGTDVETLMSDMKPLVRSEPIAVLIDASKVTGFDRQAAGAGSKLLAMVKLPSVKRTVAVTENSAVRMVGRAASFTAGLSMTFVATEKEAFDQLLDLL